MNHDTDTLIVTCIDFRLQKIIKDWQEKRFANDYQFDKVALAGGIFDLYAILHQVEIADRLHHIKTVILINHEDCGAYGQAGTFERHTSDLARAKNTIEKIYPHLKVETYYLYLNGTLTSTM